MEALCIATFNKVKQKAIEENHFVLHCWTDGHFVTSPVCWTWPGTMHHKVTSQFKERKHPQQALSVPEPHISHKLAANPSVRNYCLEEVLGYIFSVTSCE